MTTTIYAETEGSESSAAPVSDDCDANTCFFCTSPETD
jgi:hypothetical protein